MSNETNWKEYLGKRVLICYSWHRYKEVRVNEVSPSGRYVKIDNDWIHKLNYEFVEVLV